MKDFDKKTMYRYIVRLQNFASCYNCKIVHGHRCYIFECTAIGKDEKGKQVPYVTFMLSKEDLPDMDTFTKEMIELNYLDIHMLSESEIRNYIYQCSEFGIYVKKS